MAEYIEREALIAELDKPILATGLYGAGIAIATDRAVAVVRCAPAADVVAVVRCKDCDHRTHDGAGKPYCLELEMYLNKELDFFCSYGERRDGENT